MAGAIPSVSGRAWSPGGAVQGVDALGPPVFLLHGGMLDTAQGVRREVAPALASDHHVHLIDLPRHGGSRPWWGILDELPDEFNRLAGDFPAATIGSSARPRADEDRRQP